MVDQTITMDLYQALLDNFTGTLESTDFVVQRQTDGLAHADSLVQLPFRGNCMNWVLGHIINARGRMLRLLDEEPIFSETESALYDTGSDAIIEDGNAVPFDRLLMDLRKSTETIKAAIEKASQATLLEVMSDQEQTRLNVLLGLAWHETYHSGQFEILRQATGVNDKIF